MAFPTCLTYLALEDISLFVRLQLILSLAIQTIWQISLSMTARLTQQNASRSVPMAFNRMENSSSSYYNGLAISADGSFIAFSSDASNLVNGDTNEYGDVFVHDATVKLTPIPPSTPTPRPNMPLQESAALAPASLNTQNGSTSGSLSSLGLLQQAGTEDTPSAYVTFQTPGSVYTMD